MAELALDEIVVGFAVPSLNGFSVINGPPRQWGFTVRVNFGALVD